MRWVAVALVGVAFLGRGGTCLAQETGGKGGEADSRASIAGVWRGNSVCVDKNSPCHDEVNVYRFSKVEGKPNAFAVTASKVVEGKEIEMGSSEFTFDESRKTLECERPRIKLTITKPNWMEGALSLDDGKEYRKIRLKKAG